MTPGFIEMVKENMTKNFTTGPLRGHPPAKTQAEWFLAADGSADAARKTAVTVPGDLAAGSKEKKE